MGGVDPRKWDAQKLQEGKEMKQKYIEKQKRKWKKTEKKEIQRKTGKGQKSNRGSSR